MARAATALAQEMPWAAFQPTTRERWRAHPETHITPRARVALASIARPQHEHPLHAPSHYDAFSTNRILRRTATNALALASSLARFCRPGGTPFVRSSCLAVVVVVVVRVVRRSRKTTRRCSRSSSPPPSRSRLQTTTTWRPLAAAWRMRQMRRVLTVVRQTSTWRPPAAWRMRRARRMVSAIMGRRTQRLRRTPRRRMRPTQRLRRRRRHRCHQEGCRRPRRVRAPRGEGP